MKKVLVHLLAIIMMCAMIIAVGSGSFGMDNAGVEVDGASCIVSLNIGDYILLGRYHDSPILWRCMDIDENGMLMLKVELCSKEFDGKGEHDAEKGFLYGSNSRRYWGSSNYWGDSNIRSWLNSSAPAGEVVWLSGNFFGNSSNTYRDEKGFLADGNFTVAERNAIKEVTQKSLLDGIDAEMAIGGSAGAWGSMENDAFHVASGDMQSFVETRYDNICFEYTTDKVFLLDAKQWINIAQNEDILGEGFNIFKHNLLEPLYITLRTPYGWPHIYSGHGDSNPSGDKIMKPLFSDYSNSWEIYLMDVGKETIISPAFYLNEANAQILSGSGTEDDPYVIDGRAVGDSQPEEKEEISVFCNGTRLEFDQPPIIESDRVLVPMRVVFETLGAVVDWEEETQTVTAVKGDTKITLQIGSDILNKNDELIKLDVPARLLGDRTLVPIRAVSEAFSGAVEWNPKEGTVVINI